MTEIIIKLQEMGYKIHKGTTSAYTKNVEDIRCSNVDDPYSFDYGSVCVERPNGEVINITGRLDQKLTIGGVETTREELIRALYQPTDRDWFIYTNKYSPETDEIFKTAYEKCGLIEYTVQDLDYVVEQPVYSKKEPIKTPFINAEGEVLLTVDDKYVLEFTIRADADVWMIYHFYFNRIPSFDDMKAAYDISGIKTKLRTYRMNEKTAIDELNRI